MVIHRQSKSFTVSKVHTSLSGKQSAARDSPTSGSESLVTAPSDIDAAGSRPFRPDPVRPRTDGVALQLANRLQGGAAESLAGGPSGGGDDGGGANFGALDSLNREHSPGALSGPAMVTGSETQGTEGMSNISAEDLAPYDEHGECVAADVPSAARDYAESRLRDRPEWNTAQRLEPRMRRLYLIVLPAAAGLSAGLAVLFSKISVEMAKSTVMSYDNPYSYFHAYLFVVYMLVLLSLQVKLLNQAMVASDHAFSVVAHYQVVRLATCIMGGILFFHEAETMTAGENFLFATGCIVCVVGTLKMQGQTTDLVTDETDTSPAGHGRIGMGNGTHRTGSVDEPVLGGAARDELDDLLHLLEIDTTTRNCEPLFCSLSPAVVHPWCVVNCVAFFDI